MKRLLLLALSSLPAWAQCPAGYNYYKPLTVQGGKVAGTQSNFRALILNPTAASHKLATIANGGRVTSSGGYDIVPSTMAGTQLPFELLGYTASNGNLQMWVNVSSITDGTVINLCYGNAAITTYQGNPATTWSGYTLVSHAEDNAANTAVVDSTGNWPGTAAANTSAKTAAGKIGNALTFNGSTDKIDFGDVTQFNGASALTVSMWVKTTASADYMGPWAKYDYVGSNGAFLITLANTDPPSNNNDFLVGVRSGTNNTKDTRTTSHPFTNNTWHLVTWVFDGSQGTANNRLSLYVDGTAVALGTFRGALPTTITSTTAHLFIGGDGGAATLTGLIDDTEVTATAWNAGLVSATFNNQNAPGNDGTAGFWSVGGELPVSGGATTMSSVPAAIPNGHAGNITLTLAGVGTSWSNASTVFTIGGVSNVTKVSQNVTSATAATLVVTTAAGTGSLNISETVTGSASTTIAVGVPSFSIDVVRGNLSSMQTLSLTGVNTVWSQEAAGLFSVAGGLGAGIGTPAISTNTTGTVQLTVGTLAGPLTITDASTGKTATFAAGGAAGPSGCAVVLSQ